MRPVRPLLFAAALLVHAAGGWASPITVETLDVDATDAVVPTGAAAAAVVTGDPAQVFLPYRSQGTWLRVRVPSVPVEPRLVVTGVAMGPLELVLPGGRRITRDRTRPAADAASSPIAASFALPDGLAGNSTLYLHSYDRHRNLVEVRVIAAAEWRERERATIGFGVAFYGAIAAFMVIAATYWTILRERMFADHALYLASLLVFMTMSSGVFYVPFAGGFLARRGIEAQWAFATFAIAFAVGFATRFIDVARQLPRTARALDALRLLLLALGAIVLVLPGVSRYYGAAMALVLVVINAALVGLGFFLARTSRYVRYFLLGWIPLTLCTSARALQGTGLLQIGYEMSFLYALGAIWEAVVLTAGIADRALSFRVERDFARHLAEHDGLTGVLNRRAAEARLDEAFARSRSSATPLAVFFLDIDHFKSINDRYGHAAGDAVLVAMAKRVAGQLRACDVLGRWGGEEFVTILAGASVDVVRATAERVRRAVEDDPVHVEGALIPVTASIGVAILEPRTETSARLVQRADEALYRAKGNGRNRVEEAAAA
jgi:diguanylate cyclase (GGDEF)-like protein